MGLPDGWRSLTNGVLLKEDCLGSQEVITLLPIHFLWELNLHVRTSERRFAWVYPSSKLGKDHSVR